MNKRWVLILSVALAAALLTVIGDQVSKIHKTDTQGPPQTDSALIDNSFRSAFLSLKLPRSANDEWVQRLKSTTYEEVEDFDTSTVYPSFEEYFHQELQYASSGPDSLFRILKQAYRISNYGWTIEEKLPVDIPVEEQYRSMIDGLEDGLCGEFSEFLTKVCEYYDFSAVTVRVRTYGKDGSQGHIFTLAEADTNWYVLESTTGQMLTDMDGNLLTYRELIDQIEDHSTSRVKATEPLYGRFLQLAPGYLSNSFAWFYGQKPKAIVKQTKKHTVISVERSLDQLNTSFFAKDTYLQYLKENGYEANWICIYDIENVEDYFGDAEAITEFESDFKLNLASG